ncbi:MAG TPA: TolC family protein, partial [Balneolaceae bacterium]|nr:TolC family protein [Balneolaceae bacterium]
MKTLQIFIITVVTFLFAGLSAQAQQPTPSDSLTLDDAIHYALTNQPSLEKVQAQVKAAKAQIGQAKSAYYPHTNVKGGYDYISPVSSLNFNGTLFQVQPKNNYDVHLAANQLIYNFGKTQANIQLAQSRALTAEQRTKVVKWTISYFTAQTFYSVLYEDRNLKVVNKQLKQLHSDLQIARKKKNFGAATKYDVLTIKVRIAKVKNRKQDLKNQKQKLIIRLRKLFGWQPGRPVLVAGKLQLKPVQHVASMSNIYKSRPDYQVLQQKEKALEQAFKVSKLSKMPSLTAGGTAGFKNGYQPKLNEFRGNYSIGLHLNVPIFEGFASHYKQQEA